MGSPLTIRGGLFPSTKILLVLAILTIQYHATTSNGIRRASACRRLCGSTPLGSLSGRFKVGDLLYGEFDERAPLPLPPCMYIEDKNDGYKVKLICEKSTLQLPADERRLVGTKRCKLIKGELYCDPAIVDQATGQIKAEYRQSVLADVGTLGPPPPPPPPPPPTQPPNYFPAPNNHGLFRGQSGVNSNYGGYNYGYQGTQNIYGGGNNYGGGYGSYGSYGGSYGGYNKKRR
ncbi:unnamed protein product [Orchesella dallaii]|uniref:Uncharacterized protein n=1 Tax=Orchesella dallaii TaxID=48710 RepID=A0ABP1RMX0_9HEXA